MPWVKIDDKFPQHPKIAAAGPLAIAMQVAGLCYCNRELTDGFIPRSIARTLLDWQIEREDGQIWDIAVASGFQGVDLTCGWVIDLLVEAAMWDVVDGGYRIHDYLDFQPSREQVLAERGATAKRVSDWRERKKQDNKQDSNSVGNGVTNGTGNAPVTPTPVPVPVPVPGSKEPIDGAAHADASTDDSRKNTRGTRFSPDAELTQEFIDAANALDFPEDRIAWEFDEFRDYWVGVAGSKGVKLDWVATWRNHLRRHIEQRGGLTPIRKLEPGQKSPDDWSHRKAVLA